jgi:RNA polymerase sigma factor (sigma-70 family)
VYTVEILIALIQYRGKVNESKYYSGEITSSNMLMDLDIILNKINLTDKQAFILNRYWGDGYTQEEVAKELGVSQQMVEKHCRAIKKKMGKVLQDMGEIDNGE